LIEPRAAVLAKALPDERPSTAKPAVPFRSARLFNIGTSLAIPD